MGYPTTAELIAASSGEAHDALAALTEEQADALRADSIQTIEDWTHQQFTAEGTLLEPVTKAADGTGADTLYLPRRLATLTAFTVDGAAYQLADVAPDPDGAYLAWTDPLVAGSWVTLVRRTPGDPGPLWPVGRGNVLVSGVWGWTDDDWAAGKLDDVAAAIRFDMEDQALANANKLAVTVRSHRALGIKSISQGGLSVTLDPSEPGLSMRAQKKLLRFRWDLPLASIA